MKTVVNQNALRKVVAGVVIDETASI